MLIHLPPWSPPALPPPQTYTQVFFLSLCFLEKWRLEYKPELDTLFCRTIWWKQKIAVYFVIWDHKADLNNPEQLVNSINSRKFHVYPQTLYWIRSRKVALEVFPQVGRDRPLGGGEFLLDVPISTGDPRSHSLLGEPHEFLHCFLLGWKQNWEYCYWGKSRKCLTRELRTEET